MSDVVNIWCSCGHTEAWHFQGGACTWLWEGVHVTRNCECGRFEVGHIEAFSTDEYERSRER
ncbi:hypothetical protein SEA_ODAY_115 [Gordonia phage ODay]|nr:hypothetical protein SEA_ODAY_115 [Gordonia phage ODay]